MLKPLTNLRRHERRNVEVTTAAPRDAALRIAGYRAALAEQARRRVSSKQTSKIHAVVELGGLLIAF